MDRIQEKRRSIGLKLTVLARIMRSEFDKRVASLNVTRSQWTMITTVSHFPGETQRVLADSLEMSEASAGRLIDKLCSEGLLHRRAKKDDRRARSVNLTEQARSLLDDLSAVGMHCEERLFAGLDEADLDRMRDLLDRIYGNIGQGCSGGYNRIDEVYRDAGQSPEAADPEIAQTSDNEQSVSA